MRASKRKCRSCRRKLRLKALADKKTIACACLVAVFNLPMSTVMLVEDLLMVLMAAVMLAMNG
jgi:hypothetical protein